ncbi:MAG: mechanosensitive ion channel [Acidobacteria bacterium]|nr:mechanosensitive ion channel [Acidobacteriota bacterium]
MQDALAQTYYGNTVLEWGLAFGIALGAVLAGKILYWVFGGVLRRAASRTETDLDDIAIELLNEPVVLGVTAVGLQLAFGTLSLPAGADVFFANAFRGLLVVSIAWLVVRIFDSLVVHYLAPFVEESESDLDDQLLPIIRRGGKTALWAIGIIMALNNAGYDVAALIAGLGIGGLALAMAAQDTVKNVFGGFTIFTDQPFKLNDRVQVSGFDGKVEEIGVRSTRLRTLEGRMVTIPNADMANSPIENITSEPYRKVVMTLGLTYDTPPDGMQQAMDILASIEAAQGENTVEEPVIGFAGFGDFSMNLLFIYYIAPEADIVGTQTAVNMAILSQFNEAGLSMAFPTQTIELAGTPPTA